MAEKQMTVQVELEEGELLGLFPNGDLVVTYVQPHTQAFGHFELGDVILAVNGRPVDSRDSFYRLVTRIGYPICAISIKRKQGAATEAPAEEGKKPEIPKSCPLSIAKAQELEDSVVIYNRKTEEWERLIKRQQGYEYHYINVDCIKNPNQKLGLAVFDTRNKVIVSDVLENSHAASSGMKKLDRVLVINGSTVSDRNVAKRMITMCAGVFAVAVERAIDAGPVQELKEALQAMEAQANAAQPAPAAAGAAPAAPGVIKPPPEYESPVDVQEIAAAQLEKFRQYRERRATRQAQRAQGIDVPTEAPLGVLKTNSIGSNPSPSSKTVQMKDEVNVVPICRDTPENKKLRSLK